MKVLSFVIALMLTCCYANGKDAVYYGSTPADIEVREFLGISLTDSVDFIKWKMVLSPGQYSIDCEYGLCKNGTNGFTNGQKVTFSGATVKEGAYYSLQHGNKNFYLAAINTNLLHLCNKNKMLLPGNGGYSYALNIDAPVQSSQFDLSSGEMPSTHFMVYQGRTPCRELSALLGRQSSAACDKLKWYVILYTDSATGKPSYYLEGGRGYKKESMAKGSWTIIQQNGRIIYKLEIDKRPHPMYLLKAGENILLFTDAEGHLLIGNSDFSYTLNRTAGREPWANK